MAFDPKNVQILLVEDTAVMRKIEIKTLKTLGFDGIVEAVDGDQAIGILQGGRKVDLIDLRVKFGLGAPASGDRSCIVVLDSDHAGQALSIGVAVDSVSEVLTIHSSQIDPTPTFGARIDTRHILAMAKAEKGIRMLLDIDHVLQEDERLARWVSPEDVAHAA